MTYDVICSERAVTMQREQRSFRWMLILAIFVHILILYIYFPNAFNQSARGNGLLPRDEPIVILTLPPVQSEPPEVAPQRQRIVHRVSVIPSTSPEDTIPSLPVEADYTIDAPDEIEMELPPPSSGPLRAGANVVLPRLVQSVAPIYPPQAIRFRIEGDVVIDALVSKTGLVSSATVIRSDADILNDAALNAVRAYRYSPGSMFDVPQDVYVEVTVRFAIR